MSSYCSEPLMTPRVLFDENRTYAGGGGVSQHNRSGGFRPAFRDVETGIVYLACFADGRPAPMHILDGLPDGVVIARAPCGRVVAAKPSVVAGFVREGRFFTREQAAQTIVQQPSPRVAAKPNWRRLRTTRAGHNPRGR